ncbi:hypothetical protein LARV_03045 [Longilinea arvoryzae]|uniref:Uncharacterized protein n=1 Tax=Longilinea arvoryzae TaxID=360412 RepID=A0A0S7BHS5_9CHLR|nr:hypothetical protein [Longilinea arvoryzae]GAP15261.1 hypothetical protein LARV_03045 [Longilinea arvoryzae]
MSEARDPLEILWDAILSREPKQIRAAFVPLNADERKQLITHLKRMVGEEGWHPEQRKSARVALDTLKNEEHS